MNNNYKTFTAPKILGAEGEGLIKAWINHVPIEDGAVTQLKKVASMPFIYKHVAVMPDAHIGKGSTIGTVFASKSALIPAAVGVDLGCVDKDTEFLTSTGWKKIDEYSEGDDVLVYNVEAQTAFFERPVMYIKRPTKGFHKLKTKYGIDQMLSGEHKTLTYKAGRQRLFAQPEIMSANELVERHNSRVQGIGNFFKTSPEYVEIDTCLPYSDIELKILVMTAADCCINGSSALLKVKKLRKYDRAMTLLGKAGIKIISHRIEECDDGSEIYNIRFPLVSRVKSLDQLWGASRQQLKIIADEILYWDGSVADGVFYTSKKAEADFVQWAFMACGRRAVLRCDDRGNGNKPEYRVFTHDTTLIGMKAAPKYNVEFIPAVEGDMEYCFTVSTGFFIIRRNGQTVITGNCGMSTVRLSLRAEDLPDNLDALRSRIEALIPHGRTNNGKANVDRGARGTIDDYIASKWNAHLADKFNELKYQHQFLAKANSVQHLGTLGTGNHFIELCLDTEGHVWIMLHSGSRGVGNTIGMHFIEKAKKEMAMLGIKEALPDEDLAYLQQGTKVFDQYLEAVDWAQLFAKVNREIMMEYALQAVREHIAKPFEIIEEAINSHHNYVSKEVHYGDDVYVTRKGAVAAHKGQLGIIPGSMGAKSFIVRGLGNSESFCSCSHGAGRIMSRTAAKKLVTIEEHIADTAGVNCRKDESVLDETPKAYKNIEDVMRSQSDLVEIVHTLKQVLCVKG